MGTMNHPIGELFNKVNDGRYHVVRFTRNGPNSTVQVDDLDIQTKNPTGKNTKAQSRITHGFTFLVYSYGAG